MQSAHRPGVVLSPIDKSVGKASAHALQRDSWEKNREIQEPQTWRAGQLRHTAHWLINAGNGCQDLNPDLKKIFSTCSIYLPKRIRQSAPHLFFMTTNQCPPTLDPLAVTRWQGVAPLSSPWLHEEVASRMQDRLQWIKLQPQVWANWGAVRGGLKAHEKLSLKYSKSTCFVAESSEKRKLTAINAITIPWWKPSAWLKNATRFEVPPPVSLDMLWANMALHESANPQDLLAQWHQMLKVNGFLMFSCLGPDTAIELRNIYKQMGWPPAGHELTDMHDWGDMLVQAGFAEPVMDMERITLTYETPGRLLQELVELGRNFHPGRFAALRGRDWRGRLEEVLKKHLAKGDDGRLSLTYEVIYGHALKPPPKVKISALSSVSVADMRNMLKSPRVIK